MKFTILRKQNSPRKMFAKSFNPRFVPVSGEMLRRLRTERAMTQLQLGNAAGYTERLVRKAEKGGRLDIATVQNLAEALSQFGEPVSFESLLQDNLSTVKLWMQSLNELGLQMLAVMELYLADDFVLQCPGDPQITPFAGRFEKLAGFQRWLDAFFGTFTRQPSLDVEFVVGTETIVARWMETIFLQGIPCGPIRVSMYFRFRDGLIVQMDDDYDTKAGEDAIRRARDLLKGRVIES